MIGLIIFAGLNSLFSLPTYEDPIMSARWATIETHFPGAGATRVEALITEKLENQLTEIEEIKTTNSTSTAGISAIYIELAGNIIEVDGVWARIRDKISEAEKLFPEGARSSELTVISTPAYTLLFGLTGHPSYGNQLDLVGRLAKDLEHQLSNLPNTEDTEVYGVPEEEILVSVDVMTLASAGLTVSKVAQAIGLSHPNISSGKVSNAKYQTLVEIEGELDSINRVRQVPIHLGQSNQILTVGDLAQVEKTKKYPPSNLALVNGELGVMLAVRMGSNSRIDVWTAKARLLFDNFVATLPDGIDAQIIFDQSQYTEHRMSELGWNLLLGALLVVVILWVMMGWRSALLVASALPLTLLMVLPFFKILEVSLHQVSITGLIIALGLLIDNAIVTVDEYSKRRRKGVPPDAAVTQTVQRLFPALLASTITTVLTFLPLVLMPGNAGEFISELGTAVILALLSSFILSMTIIPALAGYSDRLMIETNSHQRFSSGISPKDLHRRFENGLKLVLSRPWLGICGSILIPILGFVASQSMVDQLFPPVDRDQFDIQIKLAANASLDETRNVVKRVRKQLHTHPEVKQSHWLIGGKPPKLYYNRIIKQDGTSNFAWGFVTTGSPAETKRLLNTLQTEMMTLFTDAEVLTLPFEQGAPIEAPIQIRIYGPDLDILRRLGEQIRRILSETQQVTFTHASITGGLSKLKIVADEYQAVSVDIRLVEMANQLSDGLDGVIGGAIFEKTEEIPVRIRVREESRSHINRIASQFLLLPTHISPNKKALMPGIPINALGEIVLVPEVSAVTRKDGLRNNFIQAYLEPFSLPSKTLVDFKRRLAASDFQLPPGYNLVYAGESKESSEAKRDLMSVLIPVLIIMVGTIVMVFNSFRYAAIIALVGLLSVGAALFSAWFFNYPLGFMVIIGAMGLIGLSINDSIIVLTSLTSFEFETTNINQQVCTIIQGNSRHIFSTTLTTVVAFLPLIWSGGDFWPPLAVAIVGGIVSATLFALVFVPSCFILLRHRSEDSNENES